VDVEQAAEPGRVLADDGGEVVSLRRQPATTSGFTGTRLSGVPSIASLSYQNASSRAISFT